MYLDCVPHSMDEQPKKNLDHLRYYRKEIHIVYDSLGVMHIPAPLGADQLFLSLTM